MEKYQNRQEAGQVLARELRIFAGQKNVIVLGLPRGGVPVAFEIAQALHAPLDVFVIRKLGVPGQPELAMGAIAAGNAVVFNQRIIRELGIAQFEIDAVIAEEQKELKRRETVYRGLVPFPSLKEKIVILVDDGIATGASMRAAVQSLKQLQPASIIVAVPVAENSLCNEMELLVDRFVCPLRPSYFYAVGAWYDDFSQTQDAEVHDLLAKSRMLTREP
jgi:predicted phosphoribosyltransferase